MKPLSRTHCQVDDTTYRLYPVNTPVFYKKSDGTFGNLDLTFNDTTSTIGDISLMDKGIASVGKRKGNNPNKIVGVRPDGTQHLGTQQLEFSLINVELDGESQNFNVETDLEIKLENARINQLVKLNKPFRNCKIEFDIHTKGIELQNNKYTSTTKIADYGFKLTNIGENNGNTTLGLHSNYSRLNKDIPYFDFNIGKIIDNYITTGEYSLEEEFGDSDLSSYTINENMYPNGSAVYYKNSIIFTVQSYNIEDYKDIIINNLCDMYGLEDFDDGGSGKYLTKDNKKVIGYYWHDNVFFGFINTNDIPDEIKALFKRKSFEDTSFLNISLTEFCADITTRFNKDLSIEVNDNYYEPINDEFDFKISEKSYYICNPVAFDSEYNRLNYYTTHTLTDNEDGSYRYTKYLKPESSLNVNTAQYLDADLALDQSNTGRFQNRLSSTTSSLTTSTSLNSLRNATQTTSQGAWITGNILLPMVLVGDARMQSTSSGQSGTTKTRRWTKYQGHFIFNTSGITDTVSSAVFSQAGSIQDHRGIGSGSGTALQDDISVIALKSTWDGSKTNTSGLSNSGVYTQWNDFTGHTSGWDADDVTEYSSEAVWEYDGGNGGGAVHTNCNITLNADAKTAMEDDSSFKLAVVDYDEYYLNSLDSSYTESTSSGTTYTRWAKTYTYGLSYGDLTNTPYIEYTGGGVSTPTYNATFFGTNF